MSVPRKLRLGMPNPDNTIPDERIKLNSDAPAISRRVTDQKRCLTTRFASMQAPQPTMFRQRCRLNSPSGGNLVVRFARSAKVVLTPTAQVDRLTAFPETRAYFNLSNVTRVGGPQARQCRQYAVDPPRRPTAARPAGGAQILQQQQRPAVDTIRPLRSHTRRPRSAPGQAAARRGPELSEARAGVHQSAQPVQPRTKCQRD